MTRFSAIWRAVRASDPGEVLVALLCWLVALSSILWLVGAVVGCHHPDPAKPVPVVIERRACLVSPPPPTVEIAAAGPPACRDGFAACLTRQQLIDLARGLFALQRYARDAYSSCGPLPAASTPDGGPP